MVAPLEDTSAASWWLSLAQQITGRRTVRSFRAMFGLSPQVVAFVWTHYLIDSPFQPKHFLWALAFLKIYTTMDVLHPMFCGSRDNFAAKVWLVLNTIVEQLPPVRFFFFFFFFFLLGFFFFQTRFFFFLSVFFFFFSPGPYQIFFSPLVQFDPFDRFDSLGHDSFAPNCASFVDCTEIGIRTPGSKAARLRYYGRKKKYTFKYEVWARFPDGRILAIFGPYPGTVNDGKIYNATIVPYLRPGEKVLADKAYIGCASALAPIREPRRSRSNPIPRLHIWERRYNVLVRCRRVHIERVFLRMKRFQILVSDFRHPLEKHQVVVAAIGKLVNVELDMEPLFHSTPSYQLFRGHLFSLTTPRF
jgi:transposase